MVRAESELRSRGARADVPYAAHGQKFTDSTTALNTLSVARVPCMCETVACRRPSRCRVGDSKCISILGPRYLRLLGCAMARPRTWAERCYVVYNFRAVGRTEKSKSEDETTDPPRAPGSLSVSIT